MFASEISASRRNELLTGIAERTVQMRLTPVAVVMLEAAKPLSFVGSQLLVFFQPIVSAILPLRSYDEVTALLEDRANIEALIQMIEELEDKRQNGQGKDHQDTRD